MSSRHRLPWRLVLVVTALLFQSQWCLADQSADSDDLAVVQGTWERRVPPDASGDVRRAVKEIHGSHEVVTYYGDGDKLLRAHEVDFKLDRRGDVKIFTYFNWEATQGPDKGLKTAGPTSYIYRADNYTYAEVWGFLPGQEKRAPRLMIWVRKVPLTAAAQKAQAAIQGRWAVASQESGDKPWADLTGCELTFHGDEFIINRGGHAMMSGAFRVDPTSAPVSIDLTITQSPNDMDNGKTVHGVYELQDDQMRWCSGSPAGSDRPKELAVKTGTPHMLVVLRRANF